MGRVMRNTIYKMMTVILLLTFMAETYPLHTMAHDIPVQKGNHENWIDRIIVPDYARKFYDQMVEASDGDGKEDWLIDVTQAEQVDDSYAIKITSVSGTADGEKDLKKKIQKKADEINSYMRSVFDAFDRDHPEVFWLSGRTMTFYTCESFLNYAYKMDFYFAVQTDEYDIRAEEYQSVGAIQSDIANRDIWVDAIISSAPGESDMERVCYFNQWLTEFNGYNTIKLEEGYIPNAALKCLSALEGNFGEDGPVCEGYSRAFKVLCDAVDIPCCLTDGMGIAGDGNAESHMWNQVRIGDAWYGVDVTFNDPLVDGEDTDGVTDYLLVGKYTEIHGMEFEDSHQPVNQPSKDGAIFTNQPPLSEYGCR